MTRPQVNHKNDLALVHPDIDWLSLFGISASHWPQSALEIGVVSRPNSFGLRSTRW